MKQELEIYTDVMCITWLVFCVAIKGLLLARPNTCPNSFSVFETYQRYYYWLILLVLIDYFNIAYSADEFE